MGRFVISDGRLQVVKIIPNNSTNKDSSALLILKTILYPLNQTKQSNVPSWRIAIVPNS